MLAKIKTYNWLVVIVLFIIAELIIDPRGEFPLNDDWAYSKAIATFLKSGEIKLLEWQAIPFFTPHLIGLTVCEFFGFSFTVLRLISISATILIIITVDKILKTYEVKPDYRFIILLVLVFNPLTLSLSNTFMPDVFLLMFSLLAFLFMSKTVKELNTLNFILFMLFAAAATLVRQTGIILPLVFAIVYIAKKPLNINNIALALLPFMINLLALMAFVYVFKKTGKLPNSFNYQFSNIIQAVSSPSIAVLKSFTYYFITSTICLGLFLLPFTISNLKNHFIQIKNHLPFKIIVLLYLLVVVLKVIYSENIFPFVGNIMYHIGVGAVILTGYSTQEIIIVSYPWAIFWKVLNILGGISFCCAMIPVFSKIIHEKLNRANLVFYFVPLLFVLYIFPICLSYANDRYLLFIFPFLILVYVLSFNFQFKKASFLIAFIPILFFSIAGTHDYMNFHRARWKAANYLTNELKISPANIDGGYEFNAWYLYGSKTYNPNHEGRWWWIEDDTYMITPKLIEGYKIESEFNFSNWLVPDFEKLYILKRIES